MVLTNDGPKVIEIATRLSGGWFSTDQIPIGLGIDLIGSAIKLALGEEINTRELIPKYNIGVAIRYFLPQHGIVKEIKNQNKFKDVSWIHKLQIFIKPGDIIDEVTNHTQRSGFIITTGDTQVLAAQRALEVIDTIKIITIPIG